MVGRIRIRDGLRTAALSQIMRKNQISYHIYADDTQIYLSLSPNDYSPIDSLCQCIDEINIDEVGCVRTFFS